jgi:mitogen-activated protein kinase organizer 1
VTMAEVITASIDGCARTYDLRYGRLTTDHMGDPITSMVVSGDGNCLLMSILTSCIRLIDRTNGELLNEYKADGFLNKESQVDSCLTSDDGAVISGSEDGAIRYWDLVSGELLRKLPGHTGVVTRLAVHPSKNELLSVGIDGTLRIWS